MNPGQETIPTILFVVTPAQLGGSNRSIVDVLRAFEGRVHRVLAAPGFGGFIDLVDREGLADEKIAVRFGYISAIDTNGTRITCEAVTSRNENSTSARRMAAFAARRHIV